MRAFKKSAERLKRVAAYEVWQDGNHPIHLDRNELLQEKLDYIHNNPVESEIVEEPHHYWYSSAKDYSGDVGLLKVVPMH